ncbi:hypothetical protein TNCV_801851 [Trichonephila clavipes]|nr:hypothetical protein TNCV_801851 [Trichonephila clavipes]
MLVTWRSFLVSSGLWILLEISESSPLISRSMTQAELPRRIREAINTETITGTELTSFPPGHETLFAVAKRRTFGPLQSQVLGPLEPRVPREFVWKAIRPHGDIPVGMTWKLGKGVASSGVVLVT